MLNSNKGARGGARGEEPEFLCCESPCRAQHPLPSHSPSASPPPTASRVGFLGLLFRFSPPPPQKGKIISWK